LLCVDDDDDDEEVLVLIMEAMYVNESVVDESVVNGL
jgi:hypothetical protein